jgi:hypothetical protein
VSSMYPSGKDRPTFDDIVHFVCEQLPDASVRHEQPDVTSANWAEVIVSGVAQEAFEAALPAIRHKLPPYVAFRWTEQ